MSKHVGKSRFDLRIEKRQLQERKIEAEIAEIDALIGVGDDIEGPDPKEEQTASQLSFFEEVAA